MLFSSCAPSQNFAFLLYAASGSHTHTHIGTHPLTPTHPLAHKIYFLFLFPCSPILSITLVVLLSHMNIYTCFLKCSAKWTQCSLFWCWSGSYHKESAWFKSSMWLQIPGSLCEWWMWCTYPLLNFLICIDNYNFSLSAIKNITSLVCS